MDCHEVSVPFLDLTYQSTHIEQPVESRGELVPCLPVRASDRIVFHDCGVVFRVLLAHSCVDVLQGRRSEPVVTTPDKLVRIRCVRIGSVRRYAWVFVHPSRVQEPSDRSVPARKRTVEPVEVIRREWRPARRECVSERSPVLYAPGGAGGGKSVHRIRSREEIRQVITGVNDLPRPAGSVDQRVEVRLPHLWVPRRLGATAGLVPEEHVSRSVYDDVEVPVAITEYRLVGHHHHGAPVRRVGYHFVEQPARRILEHPRVLLPERLSPLEPALIRRTQHLRKPIPFDPVEINIGYPVGELGLSDGRVRPHEKRAVTGVRNKLRTNERACAHVSDHGQFVRGRVVWYSEVAHQLARFPERVFRHANGILPLQERGLRYDTRKILDVPEVRPIQHTAPGNDVR